MAVLMTGGPWLTRENTLAQSISSQRGIQTLLTPSLPLLPTNPTQSHKATLLQLKQFSPLRLNKWELHLMLLNFRVRHTATSSPLTVSLPQTWCKPPSGKLPNIRVISRWPRTVTCSKLARSLTNRDITEHNKIIDWHKAGFIALYKQRGEWFYKIHHKDTHLKVSSVLWKHPRDVKVWKI